jgi:hypothetical protein
VIRPFSVSVAVFEDPFSEAVIVALWSAVKVPVEAVKFADVPEAATVTDGGTVSAAASSVSITTAPPVEAALDMVTVQLVLAFAARLVAVHCTPETVAPPASEMVVLLEVPFSEAVMVAV